MVEFDFGEGLGVFQVTPEPSEAFGARGIGANGAGGVFAMNEVAIEDTTEATVVVPVVGTGEEFDEVDFAIIRQFDLESEPGASFAAGDGEGRISSQNELFGRNHGGMVT